MWPMFTSRQRLGLLSLIPGVAMCFMDQTILPVALPKIQEQFNAGNTALQWAVNAYLLMLAVFVLVGGKLGDRIGHHRTLFIGIIIFAVSSALCGLSQNIQCLIATRALQGIGAALLIPAQTAIIASFFPPNQRGQAMGTIVSCGSLFLILGPVIGGYLTQTASWHWIFWINLPIAAIGLFLNYYYLPRSAPTKAKIDGVGFLYFAFLSTGFILIFMQGEDWGWLSIPNLIVFCITMINTFLLLKREKTARHPFLNLTLFKHPIFLSINLTISIVQFIIMITVFRAIYFQTMLNYSPLGAGLLTFISSFPVLFLSPVGGFLSDKISPKLPIAIGFCCLIASCTWFAFVNLLTPWALVWPLLLFGIGPPLIFTPSYTAAMSSISQSKLGVAFGIVATFRNLAATAGIALIHGLMETIQRNYFIATPELKGMQRSQLISISNGSLPISHATSSDSLRETLTHALLNARIASFEITHLCLAVLLCITFIVTFIMHNRKSAHKLPSLPAEGWD